MTQARQNSIDWDLCGYNIVGFFYEAYVVRPVGQRVTMLIDVYR